VILRPDHGSIVFITQPDHAILAADLVVRFEGLSAHPRRDAILLAVREHDNGWRELDDDLVFDEESGGPLDFMNVPEPVKQRVWPRGIDRLASDSPYAAALVAEHALFVYTGNRGKPEWREFFRTLERRRAELLAKTSVPREDLAADYRFLALSDLVSLSFCNSWPDVRERFGHKIHCEGDAVIVSPAIMIGSGDTPFPLRVRARRVADRRYASVRDLRAALDTAPVEWLTGEARGRTAAV
jgi:alkanesulfonate monooxygenase SsuD/methylene tetrahydromethanopterin reductase-like flavin-dependent oxidoreductase (luciferase family)